MTINVPPFAPSPELACRLPASFNTEIQAYITSILLSNFSSLAGSGFTATDTLPATEQGVILWTGATPNVVWWNPVTGQYDQFLIEPGSVLWEGRAYTDPVNPAYVLLDGQMHDVADPKYVNIFSRYQYRWGGAGAQFRMPNATDAKQLMSEGVGQEGDSFTAGATSGATSTKLTVAQIPHGDQSGSGDTGYQQKDIVDGSLEVSKLSVLEPTLFGRFIMKT